MSAEQVTEYDEDYMVAVPNAVIHRVREALRFYERERNYRPLRGGIEPVMRDQGRRAWQAVRELDAVWEEHDRLLWKKWEDSHAKKD